MFTIKKTTDLTSDIYKDAVVIRKEVFVNEQRVPLKLELVGEQGPLHYVGYLAEKPVATARAFAETAQTWHIQRVAVLKDYRHKGLASQLLQAIEQAARNEGIQTLTLGAQDSAQAFYHKLGYQVVGEGFLDAGIAHHRMDKHLD